MLSCFARSIKPQVLTTNTSASDGSEVGSYPALARCPSITSVSTRFLGQPKLTNPIFFIGRRSA